MSAIHNRSRMAGAAALFALSGLTLFSPAATGQLGLGDPRKIYPGAEVASRPKPPMNPSFTHGVHILPGGYYGRPCVPGYYGGYFGGYGYGGYYNGGFSVGFNVGGLSLGYNQLNGYNSYAAVPPPVSYQFNYNYAPPVNNYQPATGRVADRQYDNQSSATGLTPPPLKTGEDDANDYYLNRKVSPLQKEPGLAQAVRDIETAFRNGDIRLIEKHVDRDGTLTLMSMGRSRRQLSVAEYVGMTKDAFGSIKTVSYTLDKVEPASGGAYIAYGKHVLKGDEGADRVFNVSFVLKKTTDANGAERWIITEVSADPAK